MKKSLSIVHYVWVGVGMLSCVRVCAGVHGCMLVRASVLGCVQVCMSMHGFLWVCAMVCIGVWDEFSEYLLETRVLTSADFNTYPI